MYIQYNACAVYMLKALVALGAEPYGGWRLTIYLLQSVLIILLSIACERQAFGVAVMIGLVQLCPEIVYWLGQMENILLLLIAGRV